MPIPSYHQNILTDLLYQIVVYIETHQHPYKVLTGPYFLKTEHTALRLCPDIAIINHPKQLLTRQIPCTPLLIAEITTPQTAHMDYINKLHLYMKMGIKEYIIIDWATKVATTYLFHEQKLDSTKRYALPCKVSVSTLPSLKLHMDFDI